MNEEESVIIAGGKGSRQGILSDEKPKHVLPVLNVPVIEYQLASVPDDEPAISYSEHNDDFMEEYFEDRSAELEEDTRLDGPLFPLFEAAHAAHEAGEDGPVTAMTGDAYTGEDFEDLLEHHNESDQAVTIGLTSSYPSPKACVFHVGDDDVLTGFHREDGSSDMDDLINLGMYVADPEIAELIDLDRDSFKEDDVFPELFDAGEASAYVLEDNNVNINTPYHLIAANMNALERYESGDLQDQIYEQVQEHNSYDAASNSLVHEDAEVGEATYENAVIGEDAVVADGAELRNVIVQDGASIGADAHLEDAVVGEDTTVEEGERYTATALKGDQRQDIDMQYEF